MAIRSPAKKTATGSDTATLKKRVPAGAKPTLAEELARLPTRPPFPPTTLKQVSGMLKYDGPPKTIEEMDEGITKAVRRRHAGVDTNLLVRLFTHDDAARVGAGRGDIRG